jgi:hypothetical protein
MAELARGAVTDRPWGRTLGALGLHGLTGQLTLTADGKRYQIVFASGAVVAAVSPLATDAAVRIALTSGLVSSTQVADIARRQAAAPDRDEIDLISELLRIAPEQSMRLRRRAIAQRAARTFSVDRGEFLVDDQIALPVVPGSELDVRSIIYLGARQNLSEARLGGDLDHLGDWFRLQPSALEDLPQFAFTEAERPVLERLADGATLEELEATGVEPRVVRAMVYALVSCNACEVGGAGGAGRAYEPAARRVTRPPPPAVVESRRSFRATGGTPPQGAPTGRTRTISQAPPPGGPVISPGQTGRLRPVGGPVGGPPTGRLRPGSPAIGVKTTPGTPGGPNTQRFGPGTSTRPQIAIPPPEGGSRPQVAQPPGTVVEPAAQVSSGRTRQPTAQHAPIGGTSTGRVRLTGPVGPVSAPSGPVTGPLAAGTAGTPGAGGGGAGGTPTTPPSRRTSGPISRAPRRLASSALAHEVRALIAQRLALLDQGVDHFQLLGIAQDTPQDDIRKAYFALARQLHPDRLSALEIEDEDRQAQRLFAHVNTAFAVLSDRRRRDEYLSILRRGGEAVVRAEEAQAQAMALRIIESEGAFQRGEAALRREQLPVAIAELARAVELNPGEADYHAALAWAQFCAAPDKHAVGAQSRMALEKAIELSPKAIPPRFYLGRVERILGRDAEALRHFQEVLRRAPSHQDAAAEVRVIEQRLAARRK